MAQFVLAVVALCGTIHGQETLEDSQLTAGRNVLSAFQEVVSDARGWTVRVLVDGEPAAMGVTVQEDGWILTKASRIDGAIACRFPDGKTLDAEQQHVWPAHDLALLKVQGEGLAEVKWIEGDDPDVGQWLATPGHSSSGIPLGVGIVSVPRRSVPLVRVSGVLGVKLDLKDGPATIVEVVEDTAAEKAQLLSGDIVYRINDDDISDRPSMIRMIRRHEPGQTVQLHVKRGDEELEFEVTLMHPPQGFLSRIAEQNQMGGELSDRRSGFPAVIQHDTVLAPDECGGAVVGLDGRCVGINIARAGRTESYAIPAAVILPLLEAQFANEDVASVSGDAASLPPAPPVAVRSDD